MYRFILYLAFLLIILSTSLPVLADGFEPPEITAYLLRNKLKLTRNTDEALQAGYILVMGNGKGDKIEAKRAATVVAQRNIVSIQTDLPIKTGKGQKQVTKVHNTTKTVISGKVKQAESIFSYYDAEHKSMYILMQKPLNNR